MGYQAWLIENEHKLSPKTPYERLFVENVISQVEGLDLRFFSAQMPFRHDWVGSRQCDFSIREGDLVRIAIEIDGYDKTGRGDGMSPNEFIDWERRQAVLTSLGWYVLRFANTDVKHNPNKCAELITLLLRKLRQAAKERQEIAKKAAILEAEVAALRNNRTEQIERAAQQKKAIQKALKEAEEKAASASRKLVALGAEINSLKAQQERSRSQSKDDLERLKVERDELAKKYEKALEVATSAQEDLERKLFDEQRRAEVECGKDTLLVEELQEQQAIEAICDNSKPLALEELKRLKYLEDELSRITEENTTLRIVIVTFAMVIVAAMVIIAVVARGPAPQPQVAVETPAALVPSEPERGLSSAPSPLGDLQVDPGLVDSPLVLPTEEAPVPSQQAPRTPSSAAAFGQSCDNPMSWNSAAQNVGANLAVRGPVAGISHREDVSGQPTWITIGFSFPNPNRLEVVIWGRNRTQLSDSLAQIRSGAMLCVQGEISEFRGVTQIEVQNANQLKVQ